jgi:glutaminase
VPLDDFQRFREQNPRTGERIMHNLTQLLADRLIAATNKVNFLTAN